MGTSGSHSGPGRGTPLLPPWADPAEYPPPIDSLMTPDGSMDGENGNGNGEDDERDATQSQEEPAHEEPAHRVTIDLSQARRFLRQFSRGGGDTSLSKATRSYVSGMGGPRSAARAARAGRNTTSRFGEFLSDLARGGIPLAFDRIELRPIVGRPVDEVLAALQDYLAPAGTSLDDETARSAMSATLRDLHKRYELDEGLDGLDAMDADGVRAALELYVTNYIYEQMLAAMYEDLAGEALNGDQLVRMEREIRAFIRENTKLELSDIDVLNIDWSGNQGKVVAAHMFEQAYTVWEAIEP